MSKEKELTTLIDLIYEAVHDNDLWPSVLIKLAEAMGAAQIAMSSLDRRAKIFSTLAPRTDPSLLASFKEHWALHEPLFQRIALKSAGKIYALDDLMPREEYRLTPVFNEWWQPAGRGLELAGAILLAEEQFLAMFCSWKAPGENTFTGGETRILKAALPHIVRAVHIHHRLWDLELMHLAPPERFEALPQAALLVDALARVIRANAAAEAMLDDGDGIVLRDGRLATPGGPDVLQRMITSCERTSLALGGPGGELTIPRELSRSPLHVTVTPLRPKARFTEVPWIGVGAPVAIVTVSDPDADRRRWEINLRRRFGLTYAEAGLAAEIMKGHGRKAAAQLRGISDSTAKDQLSSIFDKTGTHRQTELVRLLLSPADDEKADRTDI